MLLGAGGVGKTTLSAAYALALARAGGHVGLLGIDPARRLQSALGLELADLAVAVPGAGDLQAALLRPPELLRRWAEEACSDSGMREKLLRNAFFVALADRLASASDVLAAVRIAEWAERDPALTDLVVDTAPGLNAIEFLRRPASLTAFLEGRLVKWLRWLGRGDRSGLVSGLARTMLDGLSRVVGTRMLLELAEFLSLVEQLFVTMLRRLEAAQRWLRDGATEILLVTAVREDAAATARQLAEALAAVKLAPRAVVVNRTLARALVPELDALGAQDEEGASFLSRYAHEQVAMQRRVEGAVAAIAPVVVVPAARGLDEDTRLEALAALGERLRSALAA